MKNFIKQGLIGTAMIATISSASAMTLVSSKPIYLINKEDGIKLRRARFHSFNVSNNLLRIVVNGERREIVLSRDYFISEDSASLFVGLILDEISDRYRGRLPSIERFFNPRLFESLIEQTGPNISNEEVITATLEILTGAFQSQLPSYDLSLSDTIKDIVHSAGIDADMANNFAQNVYDQVIHNIAVQKAGYVHSVWTEYSGPGTPSVTTETWKDNKTYNTHKETKTVHFPIQEGSSASGQTIKITIDPEGIRQETISNDDKDNNGVPDDSEKSLWDEIVEALSDFWTGSDDDEDDDGITAESEGGGAQIRTEEQLTYIIETGISMFLVSDTFFYLQNEFHLGNMDEKEFETTVNAELFNFLMLQNYQFMY